MVEKWVYVASTAINLSLLVVVLTGAATAAVTAVRFAGGHEVSLYRTSRQVAANGWFELFILFVAFLNVRKILFRLNDKGATES